MMVYKLDEEKMITGSEPISVEAIKKNIIGLLELPEEEQTTMAGIHTPVELLEFMAHPEQYLMEEHAEKLKELIELIDLMGGLYIA